jgi:hypothetical protein
MINSIIWHIMSSNVRSLPDGGHIEKITALSTDDAKTLGILLANAFRQAFDPKHVFNNDPNRRTDALWILYATGLKTIV